MHLKAHTQVVSGRVKAGTKAPALTQVHSTNAITLLQGKKYLKLDLCPTEVKLKTKTHKVKLLHLHISTFELDPL